MSLNLSQLNSKKVPAQRGWYWINEGVRYFMQSKTIWISSMFLIFFSVFILINFIPIAQLFLLFLFPFIAAGLSLACADIEKGQKMSVKYLFSAFTNPNKLNILRYGLLLLILIFIVQIVASLILSSMGVSLEKITVELNAFKDNKQASIQMIFSSSILIRYFVVTIVCMLPVILINLLSPVVLVFSDISAFEAVKLSFIAGMKNLSAFGVYAAVYSVILFVMVLVFNALMTVLFQIFGNDSLLAVFIYLFLFIISLLVIVSVSYSSAYVAYKDIFLGEQE